MIRFILNPQRISSSVEMKDNSTSAISIKYHSNCLGKGAQEPTNKCDGLKVGDVVKFTAEIMVTSCPLDPRDWHQTIQIYPVGINESLIVDLVMLCDCPCERRGHPVSIYCLHRIMYYWDCTLHHLLFFVGLWREIEVLQSRRNVYVCSMRMRLKLLWTELRMFSGYALEH